MGQRLTQTDLLVYFSKSFAGKSDCLFFQDVASVYFISYQSAVYSLLISLSIFYSGGEIENVSELLFNRKLPDSDLKVIGKEIQKEKNHSVNCIGLLNYSQVEATYVSKNTFTHSPPRIIGF